MKGDNQEASSIHEAYQSKGDQKEFLQAARQFLYREKTGRSNTSNVSTSPQPPSFLATPPVPSASTQLPMPTAQTATTGINSINLPIAMDRQPNMSTTQTLSTQRHSPFPLGVQMGNQQMQYHQQQQQLQQLQPGEGSPSMQTMERKMAQLLSDDDDIVTMPHPPLNSRPSSTIGRFSSPSHSTLFPQNPSQQLHHQTAQQQQYHQQRQHSPFQKVSPPPGHGLSPSMTGTMSQIMPGQSSAISSPDILSSLFSNNSNDGNRTPLYQTPQKSNHFQSISPAVTNPINTSAWSSATPTSVSPIPPSAIGSPRKITSQQSASTLSPQQTPLASPSNGGPISKLTPQATPAKTPRKEYQPKRLWTHLEQQPGRVLANNVAASIGMVLDLRPRQELTARWMLPIGYLKEKATGKNVKGIRDLLKYLSVGLFRRGCTENGFQASIISKEILCPEGESRDDYPFRIINDTVVGTVPFYSPRTPGHVVFRLYWREKPLYTLATGPTLNVRVTENDFESSIRFILSNFKGKKVNPTSLSPLNSLSLVLEQFKISSNKSTSAVQHQFESAGRAIWGCVCESRKVLDACSVEYQKTTVKLEKLEEQVEELKERVAEEEEEAEKNKTETDDEATQKSGKSCDTAEISVNVALLKEKTKSLMSGRASCERKWRDSQLAFASILRAIVTNPAVTILLRRDLITKLRLEFELWCPLCEEFAVPGENSQQMWYAPLAKFSQPITNEHFQICVDARSKMQIRILGFDPNTARLDNVLFTNSRNGNRQMNPGAVNCFNNLSSSMGQLYQDVYFTADSILQQRESIRAKVERLVTMCDSFPPGTKVAIFGSSANGYGSPKSDLDMCLQVPNHSSIMNEDDTTGAGAMAALAQIFEENDMLDVDTSRLTARIPVIQFNCPRGNGSSEEDPPMECDLSMHNPLAVLNTSLLRSYAEINPVSRVMASVIKRWAKARDINNPARHTLSSYGYILMLLHFLTYHQRSGDGLVSPMGNRNSHALPLLPNLQWMDSSWPESPRGTPYTEFRVPPKQPMQHPREENVKVNSYFYRLDEAKLNNLRQLFPGQDLSLAILLASFFRYYAYDFDYKRHVVSLNSTNNYGIVEREVKAELDGWRNYSAALTIEDPFETFYDVAHVLRGGYYHRIRREFAVAYTKIADVASGKASSSCNNRVVDLTNMSGMDLIDWICEPVVSAERDETSPGEK